MMNFLISIIVFAASVFLLGVSLRYGLIGLSRIDAHFSSKSNSKFTGFNLYYRIPFSIGIIPEYFYAIVLGHDSYFNRSWWALKTSSFISILLFIAGVKSRSAVHSYFSMNFLQERGIIGFFTSGNFVLFMNLIVLLYLALFVLICIESIKMHARYAPVRILYYSILCILMANLTIITISLIVFISIVYLVIKLIAFFFFSSNKRKKEADDDESAGTILKGGFKEFKAELNEWENQEGRKIKFRSEEKTERKKPRRPKISRRRKVVKTDDEIPRLHPN
ncbi:MAG: hypothetical protein GXO88_10175 [Chlorobi bacterium]|nr:hypothetical protein [Chlorobiota bacterium]